MVRLPDIPIQSWLEDQASRFQEATGHYFDALDFNVGAGQLQSEIPPDFDAPGGMDQWQQAEQQRIEEELRRTQQQEEERKAQQAALEAQQRQQYEAQRAQARDAEALSWASQMGIPTPDELGSQLQGLWNRPQDHIGTTGSFDAAPPPEPAAPERTPAQQFMDWAGDLGARTWEAGSEIAGSPFNVARSAGKFVTEGLPAAAHALPEAASRAVEAGRESWESPIWDYAGNAPTTGLIRAGTAVETGAQEAAKVLGERAGAGMGQSAEAGSAFRVRIPGTEIEWAPSEQELSGLLAQGILDPQNLIEVGPAGAAAIRTAREAAPAVGRAVVRGGQALAEEAAGQLIGLTPMPGVVQGGGGGRRIGRAAEEAAEALPATTLPPREAPRELPSEIIDAEGRRVPVEIRRQEPPAPRETPRTRVDDVDAAPFEPIDHDPDAYLPTVDELRERVQEIGAPDQETEMILRGLEEKGGFQEIRNGRSLQNAERRLRAQRREHGLTDPEHDALVSQTPLGKQVDALKQRAAEAALPDRPPPPEAQPAPPKGSAPKTVDIGEETVAAAPTISRPLGLNEEVILPNGKPGRVLSSVRRGADDLVTVRLEDGTTASAYARNLERHGVPTTATSPHPGFSTGESVPLARQGSGGGRGGPPTPPTAAGAAPTPPEPPLHGPARPTHGPGSAVDDSLNKIMQSHQDIRAGKYKRAPTDADANRILRGFAYINTARQKLTDRRAYLHALGNFIARIRGVPLDEAEHAHLLSRMYEGNKDAARARIDRVMGNVLDGASQEDMAYANGVMQQLDAFDKETGLRRRVQQGVLSKTSTVTPPIGEVRREGEAVLNVQRARSAYRAAEREHVAARAERNALLREMRTLGEDTAGPERPRAPKGKQGPVRSAETERSQAAQERLEAVNLRYEISKAKLDDARQILHDTTAAKQTARDAKTAIRAEVKAETVIGERKWSAGAVVHDVDDIKANLVARVGEERATKILDIADAFYRLRDEMREAAVDSGIWSQDTAEWLFEHYPHYSPIKILEHLEEAADAARSGSSFSVRDNLIKKLGEQGTTAVQIEPTKAMLDMVFQMEEAMSRNRVMRAVIGWAEEPEMASFIQPLSATGKPPKGFVVKSGLIDGQLQRVAVLKPLEEALDLTSPTIPTIVGTILKGAAVPLRAGATALRPAFIATNAVNDAILTSFRFLVESPDPIEAVRTVSDLYAGYRASIGTSPLAARAAGGAIVGSGAEATRESRDEHFDFGKIVAAGLVGAGAGAAIRGTAADRRVMQQMREAGASIGHQSRWTEAGDILRELRGERMFAREITTPTDITSFLKDRIWGQGSDLTGLLYGRPVAAAGQIFEQAPRIAAYRRALRQAGGTVEAATEGQRMLAANAARRVTADFSAGGQWTKQLNEMVPFINAATQAGVEGFDMARKNPVQFTALTAVVVASIAATEMYNRAVAPDDYQDVTSYLKDTGMVIMSDEAPEGAGKRGLVYIPTRGIVGAMVPLVRGAMGAYYGDHPATWERLGHVIGATVSQLSPVNADAGGMLRMLAPPLALTGYELMANYDSFRQQPIVSRSLQTLPVSEQYDERTSQLARTLSRTNLPVVGGSSPMKIDYALRSISPGPGEAFLGAGDALIHMTGQDLPTNIRRNVPSGARDVPLAGAVTGRFLRTAGAERQNEAYIAADEIAAKNRPQMLAYLERSSEYQSATPDRQRQMLRSMETAVLDQAREMAGVPEFEQPKDLGLPERYRGVEPGSRLERQIASALATPRNQRTPEQARLADRYKGQENERWTEMHKRQAAEGSEMRTTVAGSLRE